MADYHFNWPLDGTAEYSTDLGYFYDCESTFFDAIPESAYKVTKLTPQEHQGKTFIKYSQHLNIGPIPEAVAYTIGNRTPLQWIIDRYQIKKDKDSGITNDPND